MWFLFAVCAAIGCTVLVFQFVLTMLGVVGESTDFGIDDPGMDADFDLDADFDGDSDFDADHVDSNWLFGMLSLKTVIAFLAFFGLGGLTIESAGQTLPIQLIGATLCGGIAFFSIYHIMRGLGQLRSDGTVRIANAIGCEGTVYTSIPAEHEGQGKIQVPVQGQLMEYFARTEGPALTPGAIVEVTAVISDNTLEVQSVK